MNKVMTFVNDLLSHFLLQNICLGRFIFEGQFLALFLIPSNIYIAFVQKLYSSPLSSSLFQYGFIVDFHLSYLKFYKKNK